MTTDEYRDHLRHFGMSQPAAAKYFDVSARTGTNYATVEGRIPLAVAMVLRAARRLELSLEDFTRLAAPLPSAE